MVWRGWESPKIKSEIKYCIMLTRHVPIHMVYSPVLTILARHALTVTGRGHGSKRQSQAGSVTVGHTFIAILPTPREVHSIANRQTFGRGTSWKQAQHLSPPNSPGTSWPTWCTSTLPSWHSSRDMISRHTDEGREMPRSKDKAKIQSQGGRCVYDQRVQIPKSDNCFVWVLYRPWLEQFPAHIDLRRRTEAYC